MSIPVMLYVDDYSEDSVDSTTSDWEESDDEDDNPVINFIIEKEILELFLVYDQHYSKFIRIDGKCDPNSNNLIKLINDSVEVNKQFLKWICMRYDRGYYHPRSRDDNQSSSEDESSPLSEDDQQVVQETTITSTAPTDVSTTAVIKTSTDTSDSPNSNIWTTKDIIYKLYNLLLLLIRDWSADGISQRECYIPFLKSLKRLYPDEKSRNKIKIVCPGGGMGRLAYEIAKLGFETVQNEMSMFLIVALKSIFIK
ncbi:hypothetical protein PPL_04739 [Heterostelium album PN500]|uniref:Carnosine N-methyltransferase n=1 Tax=Heterostelium pallidum (strain ATCC 26659 / Pp 5 / PN500) TaxID=670386 RepID=D3B8E6_HETP5|nr:hypothetical protein PPL_04739 [Heterostelium album PN500]EFA82314.1 hypothetical protein PPL_04739 [Heterostelium album PN500]|eukprot:XP_020434431.1 hypothetical protein PPL_04739 [Heterostelium album PN500]